MEQLIMDVITSAMLLEVSSLVEYHKNEIVVFFPKGKQAKITTKKVV